MRANRVVLLSTGIGVLIAAAPMLAHHSLAAIYNRDKPITLHGTVTKFEFRSPHMWVHFDVQGDAGVVQWACESGSPNRMARRGWSAESLKPGDQIILQGFPARNGTPTCQMRTVTFADGRSVVPGDTRR